MKTPSKYPVLDNRPIDQWKVPELKEELKRRKLTVGGLKQDLIKRLDEAIRAEREAAETEHNNGFEESNAGIATDNAEKTTEQAVSDTGEAGIGVADNVEKTADDADKKSAEVVVVPDPADSKDNSQQQSEDKSLEEEMSESVTDNAAGISMLTATDMPSAEMDNKVCDGSSFAIAMAGPELHDDEMERDNEDSGAQLDSEDLKLPHEDMKLNSSDPTNQVSEVSTNLGFPVKSDSISTDSVSVCEKNDLEDNIITDNVKLELDVKPEMVQPSSSNLAPDGGKSHPTDVEEPHENKISVEETDNNVIAEMSQRNHSADLCSSEKLNLDRSSGDDSLEEDALESKQIDSNFNSEEVGERPLKSEATSTKGDSLSANMDTDLPTADKSIHVENKDVVAALSEKRKLPEPEAVVNNEPSKRLRRWKSENNKVREPHISTPVALAKDVTPSAVLRRNLSGSNSVGSNDSSKEREVPPSTKAPTNSLRIDRFLRPFTFKAVQELLGKTGTVSSFWMDHIKTHCYVTYSSVEEAVATRNAVYNLQWPPNGGRNLIADFVDPQEVKMRVEAPSKPSAAPANSAPTVAPEPLMLPQPSPRQQNLRQQMPQPTLPPPPPLSNPGQARERGHPPPPPVQEKVEASIVTLDDLFRKTKATPRVYYLPLSEEQVSAKVEARLKNPRQ